jgi:hypothetical protein
MAWGATLEITDCATGSAIGGVWITDGTNTYQADAWGRFFVVVWDDEAEVWGFALTHASYVNAHVDLVKSTMAGTTLPVCMNAAGPPTGTFTGW